MGKGENEIGETMNDSKEEVKQFLAQNFSISEGVRLFRLKEILFEKSSDEIVKLNKNDNLIFFFTSLGNFSITKGYCKNFSLNSFLMSSAFLSSSRN